MKIFIEKVIRDPNYYLGFAIVMVETKHFKHHFPVMLDTKVKKIH